MEGRELPKQENRSFGIQTVGVQGAQNKLCSAVAQSCTASRGAQQHTQGRWMPRSNLIRSSSNPVGKGVLKTHDDTGAATRQRQNNTRLYSRTIRQDT